MHTKRNKLNLYEHNITFNVFTIDVTSSGPRHDGSLLLSYISSLLTISNFIHVTELGLLGCSAVWIPK